jgi:hypothetical protein
MISFLIGQEQPDQHHEPQLLYLIFFLVGQEQPDKYQKPQFLYLIFVFIGQEHHRANITNHGSCTVPNLFSNWSGTA